MRALSLLAATSALLGVLAASPAGNAAEPPSRDLSVSGTGVAMYPQFDPATLRYGVTTTSDTAGQVTVDASTTDPQGSILVDGQPAGGPVAHETLTGLTSGSEISVIVSDSTGTTAYSLIVLPAGFPALTATIDQPGTAVGDVLLTLTDWSGTTPNYEAAVDRNGVPVYVHADDPADVPLNLERQPNGNYSVYRPPPVPGQTGGQVVELGKRFDQIASFHTAGLSNTDGHDAILQPDGDRWMVAYQPNPDTGDTDAVIQEQDPSGKVLFEWDSAQDVDLNKDGLGVPGGDYAHINSIQIMDKGDLLASFRHLSQVMEIATHPHDGFATGQVVWRLGGRRSSFQFLDDPYGGPCAQHSVTEVAPDDILLFDNGSPPLPNSAPLCVDPSNPNGPPVYRNHTRVAEYQLDPVNGTATLKWSYEVPGRVTVFAGSAQRLSNGDTLIGWGGMVLPLATEVDASGNVVWELTDSAGLSSYRALESPVPDATPPAVDLTTPGPDASYRYGASVVAAFDCTDTGGSNLQSCRGTRGDGQPLDTTAPGRHTFTVTATDGAGNLITVRRSYRVGLPPAVHRPDAAIRLLPHGRYVGAGVVGGPAHERIMTTARAGRTVRAQVQVTNRGNRTERFRATGSRGGRRCAVRYRAAGRSVTGAVVAGRFRTPALRPGARFRLTLTLVPARQLRAGARFTATVRARSARAPAADDAVAARVATRG